MSHASWPVPPAATASTGCWCCTRGWSSGFAKTREWYHSTCHDTQSDLDPSREYLKKAVGVVGRFVLVVPRAAGSTVMFYTFPTTSFRPSVAMITDVVRA